MKSPRTIIALTLGILGFVAATTHLTSCSTAPSARVTEVQTLKAVGLAVDGTMRVSAQMFHDGKMTAATWQKIADLHDRQFQPAFNLAVKAVQMNLDSPASPELTSLASQLAALLAPYVK